MKCMVRALCVVGCVVGAGCATHGGGHGPGPKAVPAADVPQVQSITLVTGAGPYKSGILMDVLYGRGPSFGMLNNPDAGVRILPAENQSGVQLDRGWAYVNGSFGINPTPMWGFWPIIIRSTMAIGADGTEFVVDCTDPSHPWVHCRSGSKVKVFNIKPSPPVEIAVLNPKESAMLSVTTQGTTLVGVVQSTPSSGNPGYDVYEEAVLTAKQFGLTSEGP